MRMKLEKHFISIISLLLLSLCSCASKRTNIIVPGHYSGVDSENELISCDLFIEEISEDKYFEHNGKNVIKDAISGNYYSIIFTFESEEFTSQRIDFLNFKDAYDGATGTPIAYVDDNRSWFTPHTSLNNDLLPQSECYYSIEIDFADTSLYSYLYFMED